MITTYFLPFVVAVLAWWATRWALVIALRRRAYLRGEWNTQLDQELAAMWECLAAEEPASIRGVQTLARLFAVASVCTVVALGWGVYGLISLAR